MEKQSEQTVPSKVKSVSVRTVSMPHVRAQVTRRWQPEKCLLVKGTRAHTQELKFQLRERVKGKSRRTEHKELRLKTNLWQLTKQCLISCVG